MKNTKTFVEGGINEDFIENIGEFPENVLQSLECCICIELVKEPVECKGCQSIYCKECWEQLKIAGKGCVMRCTKPVEKANKFLFEILKKLKLKCPICEEGGLSYPKFLLHYDCCVIAKKYGTIEELTKLEKEKDEEIERLKQDIIKIKSNTFVAEAEIKFDQDEIRKELITNNLDVNSKMVLYQTAVKGDVNEFRKLINKGYSMLEEVSAKNFFWTPLHYAMHYGKMEIAFYILEELKKKGLYNKAMSLESNDKRTPVLCLLKSNALSSGNKADCFRRLVERYPIIVNEQVLKEIRNRNLEEIYKRNKK
jgi:hypothetical protein